MANAFKSKAGAAGQGGVDAFFAAADALTYREMNQVAELLSMQLAERGVEAAAQAIAGALADAAESHADTGDDE